MRKNYFLIQILLARGEYNQKSAEEETGKTTTRGKDITLCPSWGKKNSEERNTKEILGGNTVLPNHNSRKTNRVFIKESDVYSRPHTIQT